MTDTDFADDIALISSAIKNAQSLLISLEQAANSVGLHLNEKKTEYMNLSADKTSEIKTLSGALLNCKEDYKYLGSFISSSEKDFLTRKALAWVACNKLHKIWTSNLEVSIKTKIFLTTIQPILLYGSETWTLSRKIEKRLDGTYTRLLMRAKNLPWQSHPTRQQIYGNLPSVSSLVRSRRVQFAGHCHRASSEVVSSLVLWKTESIGRRSRKLTFVDTISRDTGLKVQDLRAAMEDRDTWREIVKSMISTAVEQ